MTSLTAGVVQGDCGGGGGGGSGGGSGGDGWASHRGVGMRESADKNFAEFSLSGKYFSHDQIDVTEPSYLRRDCS